MKTRAIVASLGILAALVTGAAPSAWAQTRGSELHADGAAPASGSENPIARRILERLRNDRDLVLQHRYVESALMEKLARDGTVRSSRVEVYEVFTHNGQRLKRELSREPGEDLPGLSAVRREESGFLRPADGGARPAGAAAGDGFDLETLVGCFRFYPLGRDPLDGREALRLAFTAIDGCLGRGTRAARLLGSLAGTLWLAAGDSGVLRVRGYLQRPVTFGLGVVGRVESFDLEIDRAPLGSGFYATTRIAYRARGSSLLLNRFDLRSSRRRSAFAPEAEARSPRARLSPEASEGAAATPR
jgi:hypothetical protein